MIVHSLSGHERNHLFVNGEGTQFEDISLISGLDSTADSRSFALFDFDHDGQQDIVLVNANTPLVNLYHNTITPNSATQRNRFVAIRFTGGNTTDSPSTHACRDGYGALVTLAVGEKTIVREHRCGEGYGAQNSQTMLIGIGANETIDSLSVRWPSGATTDVDVNKVEPGSLIHVRELGDTESVTVQPYPAASPTTNAAAPATTLGHLTFGDAASIPQKTPTPPKLRLYMTMATWCVACKEQYGYLETLRQRFDPSELEIIGVPIDPNEDEATIREYAEGTSLPYRQILNLTATQRRAVKGFLERIAPPDSIPGTLLTNAEDDVLAIFSGVPTVSEIKKQLDSH